MFKKFHTDTESNLFDKLSESCEFENITKGRMGSNLVMIDKITSTNISVPIVRTTTQYQKPAQNFLPVHLEIIDGIKSVLDKTNYYKEFNYSDTIDFNNALIEIYDNEYTTMGFHSDLAMDLKPNSFICIYSCYSSNPKSHELRKFVVKKKLSEEEENNNQLILLTPNSFVIFDTNTNQQYLHKIVLVESPCKKKNTKIDNQITNEGIKWLGITFRLSNQYINFINEIPYFTHNNVQLRLATGQEKKEFYKLRSKENQLVNFTYPLIEYTISPSDLIKPNILYTIIN